MTFVLGLTGGIATGKTTVSEIFKEKGIPVVDADIGARVVVEPGTDGLKDIQEHFGEEVLRPDGSLDRKALGTIVFADSQQRETLNLLLGKHIRRWIREQKAHYLLTNPPLIILDIPLLFESNYSTEVDQVMVVALSEKTQLTRLMERDTLTRETAEQRIAAQLPIAEKIKRADVVINNNGTRQETKKQVMEWLDRFFEETAALN